LDEELRGFLELACRREDAARDEPAGGHPSGVTRTWRHRSDQGRGPLCGLGILFGNHLEGPALRTLAAIQPF
jgi:hypothetical protein